jgi:N-acetylneuraminic acid mutarotase
MVFNPLEGQAILFGGRAHGLFGEKYFNDLWVLDAATHTWMSLKNSDPPEPRMNPGMVYDSANHQIILFGGLVQKGRLDDTWVYAISDNHWEEVTPEYSPPPRSDTGMVYDEHNQEVILFGGYCHEDQRDLCSDTWSYNPNSNMWTEIEPASSPPIMYGHTMDYDPKSYQSIIWGGHQSTIENGNIVSAGYGDDIWKYEFHQNSWQATVLENKPPARYWHQSVFIPTIGKLLIFGGDGGNGYLDDTWIFDNQTSSWETVYSPQVPAPRVNGALTYDSINDVVFLFGGLGQDLAVLQDTWIFTPKASGGTWQELASP